MPKELDIRQHTACVVLFFLWNSVKSIHYPVTNITIKLLSLLFLISFFTLRGVVRFVYPWICVYNMLIFNILLVFLGLWNICEKVMSFLSATWLWANGLRWSWPLKLCNTISYIFMFHLFSNHSCREIVASPDFCRFNDSKSFLLFLGL